jgi:hypothetical protein
MFLCQYHASSLVRTTNKIETEVFGSGCTVEAIGGRVLDGDKSFRGDDMKFSSIFCHTITTHTYRQPHALAGPAVNFFSLEKERTKKEESCERTRVPFYVHIFKSPSQKPEDRHFCCCDTVSRRSIVQTG